MYFSCFRLKIFFKRMAVLRTLLKKGKGVIRGKGSSKMCFIILAIVPCSVLAARFFCHSKLGTRQSAVSFKVLKNESVALVSPLGIPNRKIHSQRTSFHFYLVELFRKFHEILEEKSLSRKEMEKRKHCRQIPRGSSKSHLEPYNVYCNY